MLMITISICLHQEKFILYSVARTDKFHIVINTVLFMLQMTIVRKIYHPYRRQQATNHV